MKIFSKIFKKKKSQENDEVIVEIVKDNTISENPFASTTPDFIDENIVGEVEIYVNNEAYDMLKISSAPLVIGRDPAKASVIISEPIISKCHCTIYYESNEVFIKDNNSTNGIYMNNEKFTEKKLQDKDVVLLGKKGTVKLIFRKVQRQKG